MMTRTVAMCAGLLVLSWPRQSSGECATVPRLQGATVLVQRLTDELARRGILTGEQGCAALLVEIAQADQLVLVRLEDPYGRRSERTVATAEMAATLVETWLHPEVEEPTSPAPAATPAPALPVVTAPAPAKVVSSTRFALSAQAESALANDRSLWLGASASVCVRLGRFCAGTVMRMADDEGWLGSSATQANERRGVDVLIAGAYAISLGEHVLLLPAAGLGVAWLRSRGGRDRTKEDGDLDLDDGGGVRAEVAIAAVIPVHRQLSSTFGISAEVSPLALASTRPAGRLAAEPWGYLRAGLGLAWGVR